MTATDAAVDAESFRGELIGYCYRYFASVAEAEDAVQETMIRAWRSAADFEGRASLRTWLYRIATNVCLDMRRAPQRRSLPMDLAAPGTVPADASTLAVRPEATWVGPIADTELAVPLDPAEALVQRESVRLAFVTALQVLPPRQRAVLLLRDVFAWTAEECATLLDTSLASVNSALARARRTLAQHSPVSDSDDDEQVLSSYVEAFEAYDIDRLVQLLSAEAAFSMPPFELWLQGRDEIERWWRGPGQVCRGSRTIRTGANGQPAVAVYHHAGPGRWEPFAIHVLDTAHGAIAAITHFMGPDVFAQFGLPDALGEDRPGEKTSATTDQFS